jgi:hypothetical protein
MWRVPLFTLLLTVASMAAEPPLAPTRRPFAERLTERVPVSGRTLAGLISVGSTQPPDGVGLLPGSMALPAALAAGQSPICVRATTQDGRYFAENSFAARGTLPAAGRAELDWPTAYPDALSGLRLRELAAVARSGGCAEPAELIPVLLDEARELGILQVLVNTRGNAVTAALRGPEGGRTLRRANCTRVDGAARVAFDARCILGPASDLPPQVQLRLEQVSRDGLQTEALESVVLRLAK